ncbi:hypothetical protein ACFFLM_19110 [Deinococcus oregonensis]|uniref:Uncharacterized protein n=1 Tax=Deinococcus oregonensis TaxID=1805970 RepID=A0ABV6B6K2_9DEIO
MRLLILLLLFLTACTRSALPSAGPFHYRTTQGGAPLTWNLSIWPANKSGPPKQLTQAAPGGIDGGFRWQLASNGNTVQLEFTGRNDLLALPPRAVVSLTVDGSPAFYGIVPDPASLESLDAEGLLAAGGEEALRLTLMDGKVYRNMGVYAIARDILSRLCPPSLTYSATLIGDGTGTDVGPSLGTYYAPTGTLQDTLISLAKSAGKTWGVDAQGRVFLGIPQTAALTVAYAGQPWRRLQVQGRETVTQAVLRVATAPSNGVQGVTQAADYSVLDYLPATVTSVATAAEHPLYHAQKAFSAPEGVALTGVLRTGTVDSRDLIDTANGFDADPATASTSTGITPYLQLADTTQRVIGVRLRYTLSADATASLNLTHLSTSGLVLPGDVLRLPLNATDTPTDIVLIGPPSAYMVAQGPLKSIGQVTATAPTGTTNVLAVYDLALITVDEVAALRVATSYLQTPFAAPAELTLPYLAPPTESATVTGSPDGTVTGPTGLFEYEHTTQNVRTTKVRLGSTGSSDLVRSLRWAVRQ